MQYLRRRFRLLGTALLFPVVVLGMIVALPPAARALPPSNDDFNQATWIPSLPFTQSLSVAEATAASDDPSCAGVDANSVWYTFTATEPLTLVVDTLGSDFDTTLSAYEGSRGSLVRLACNDEFLGGQSRIVLELVPDQSVSLMVGSYDDPGTLVLNADVATVAPPAPNDDFDQATVVSAVPFFETVDVSQTTVADDDPLLTDRRCASALDATVWYAYTATADVRVEAKTVGSDYDTVVAVYSGTRGALNLLTCNDQAYRSQAADRLDVAAGQTVFFMISNWNGADEPGTLTFNLEITPPAPPNDDFDQATQIISLPFTETLDARQASTAADDPLCQAADGWDGYTVWYAYTAPANQDVRLRANTVGTDYRESLSAYLGARGALEGIFCAEDDFRHFVNVPAGETVHFMIGTHASVPAGTFVFSVDAALPASSNDDFDNAVVIGSLPFSETVDVGTMTRAADDPRCPPDSEPAEFHRTVWYAFTATGSRLRASATSEDGEHPMVSAYTGSRGSLTQVACPSPEVFDFFEATIEVDVAAGETVYLMVDAVNEVTFTLESPSSPANDDISQAVAVGDLPFEATVDLFSATRTPDEPDCLEADRTAWYAFTPDEDVWVRPRFSQGPAPTIVGAYAGAPGSLTELGCGPGFDGFVINVPAGETVYFIVGDLPDEIPPRAASFRLNVAPAPPPNDDIENATVVTALPFVESIDVSSAVGSPDDPGCVTEGGSSQGGGHSVWYAYTASAPVRIVADTSGSGYDTRLGAYVGSPASLVQVACEDATRDEESVAVSLETGQTVYIVVNTFENGTDLTFSLDLAPGGPANDDLGDATVISALPFEATVATTQASGALVDAAGCIGIGRSVWFSFTAAADVRLLVQTSGSDYSTVVAAYAGAPESQEQIACDAFGEDVRVNVQAGDTIFLKVDAAFGEGGQLVLAASLVTPPPNDDVGSATAIEQADLLFSDFHVDVSLATPDPSDPVCVERGATVWYTFTPGYDMIADVSTSSSSYDTTLAVFEPTKRGLRRLACQNDNEGDDVASFEHMQFRARAGHTYFVMVGSIGPPKFLSLSVGETVPVTVQKRASLLPSGEVVVRGTISCSHALDGFLNSWLRQPFGTQLIEAFAFDFVGCAGQSTSWSMQYPEGDIAQFSPGPATLELSWELLDPTTGQFYASLEEVAEVVLRSK